MSGQTLERIFDEILNLEDPQIIKEERKIKEEVIKRIENGNTEKLSPNTDEAVFVCGHLIFVRSISYPGSEIRLWEWDGDINIYNDQTKSFQSEYIYGNVEENLNTGKTGSSQAFGSTIKLDGQPQVKEDDRSVKGTNSDTDEDGRAKQRRSDQKKIQEVIVKLGFKSFRNHLGPVITTSDANKHKVDVDESGVEARDIELLVTRVCVSRQRAVRALKDCNGDVSKAALELITYGRLADQKICFSTQG